jgi:hypothetical protein
MTPPASQEGGPMLTWGGGVSRRTPMRDRGVGPVAMRDRGVGPVAMRDRGVGPVEKKPHQPTIGRLLDALGFSPRMHQPGIGSEGGGGKGVNHPLALRRWGAYARHPPVLLGLLVAYNQGAGTLIPMTPPASQEGGANADLGGWGISAYPHEGSRGGSRGHEGSRVGRAP